MPTNTATSFTSHTGNGTAGPFSISFSFFAETDIKVLVGGEFKTLNTHYTFTSGSQITFTSGNEPGNGVSIKFTRNTDISSKKIDFEDGSVLTEADLDTQNDQILFALQEFTDIVNNDLLLRDGSNTVIGSLQFEGSNDDNFETKITVENPTTDRTITLPNITGTVVTRSDTGTVTSTMISPGTIVNGDINPAANINGSKLSNDSVSLAKLGGGALPTDITIASANIVNGSIIEEDIATGTLDGRYYTETELDAGQLDNRYFTETELNSGQLDNRYFTESELNSGQLDNRYFTETELSSGALDARYFTETELTNGTLDSRYFTETELNNGQLDNRYFTETELNPSATTGANVLDARYYTEAEADARFYNLASSEEIQSGETWTAADNKVATTAAIDARIIDLVDDVGGFVPITNELSFPNTNPDINNGAGTLISIQALSTAYTSNGSGTFTIANGTIGNSTVTVTGATASTTFTAGFGMILETTSTLNTYTFHRLVPKATEVTTVAGNVSNVNTVAGIDSNVTTVAGIAANVTTVAGISSNVTSVAGSITNVNTVATNLSGVNAFADRYSSGSSNPTSNLDVGDLFFNTTDNELKVYNGSAWQSGVTATSNVALTTGNTFTGNNVFNDNVKALFGTGNDLQIYHNGSQDRIDSSSSFLILEASNHIFRNNGGTEDYAKFLGNGAVELYFNNSKKFETGASGIVVTGQMYSNSAQIVGVAGGDAVLGLFSDGGSQNADKVRIRQTHVGNSFLIESFASGSYQSILKGTDARAIELHHQGSKKFETTSSGAKLTGALEGDSDLILRPAAGNNNVIMQPNSGAETLFKATVNGAVELYFDNSLKLNTNSNGVRFHGNIEGLDNEKIRLGNSEDLQIFHSGTHSFMENSTGILAIRSDSFQITDKSNNHAMITATADGSVELYFDNSKKFNTTNDGGTLTGNLFVSEALQLNDNKKIEVGNSADLEIFHNGTRSEIINNTGDFIIQASANNKLMLRAQTGESHLIGYHNAQVELYYDGSKKFETFSNGIITQHVQPDADDDHDVGSSAKRFDNIHASNGTIVTSDRNEKENILTSDLGLDFINKLTPVSFKFKNKTRTHYGLVAQDIETVIKDLGKTTTQFAPLIKETLENGTERYGLRYTELLSPLIKAVQELSAKVAALEAA